MKKLIVLFFVVIACLLDVDSFRLQQASGCKGPPAHIRWRPRLNRQRRAEYARYLWAKEEFFRKHPQALTDGRVSKFGE